MHQSCGFLPGTRLKMEGLRDSIITLLTKGLSLTDVHIITEDFGLCHKSIILSINNDKLVSTESLEYANIIYN